jgi:hypothetical protein
MLDEPPPLRPEWGAKATALYLQPNRFVRRHVAATQPTSQRANAARESSSEDEDQIALSPAVPERKR